MRLKALITATLLLVALPQVGDARARTYGPPNELIILVDDMTMQSMTGRDAEGRFFLPFIQFKRRSARIFDELIYTMPYCGPSRATLFTGMYPHNHGVVLNPDAYRNFMLANLDAQSIQAQIAGPAPGGYYTAIIGKVLNNHAPGLGVPVAPQGFHYMYAKGEPSWDMFNWKAFTKNGEIIRHTCSDDTCYQTDVFKEQALFILDRQATHYQQPFFMVVAPAAPHRPGIPSKKWKGEYTAEPFQPRTEPSFNEPDVSDKPAYIRAKPQLTETKANMEGAEWRRTLEASRSVDDLFKAIWLNLEASGQLANTRIWFMSDNGFLWHRHRVLGKPEPYRESVRGTMMVWGPGVVPGHDPNIVTLADIFPTIMESAGRPVPPWVDGRSLTPLLRGENPAWRTSILVQSGARSGTGAGSIPFIGTEYLSLAWKTGVYTNYDGEAESYDFTTDPYELTNIAGSLDPAFEEALLDRIEELYACKGAAQCGAIEDAPLPVR
jgi:N-acetylglucosamine-6-sulfatase